MERLNNLHSYPYGFIDNENDEKLDTIFNRKLTKKSDMAISYIPEEKNDLRLYLLVCEAKRPGEKNSDYEKLLKMMRDCYNSWILYYSKLSANILEDIKLFKNIQVYGLHIYGKLIL